MSAGFWDEAIIVIFFFYGLAFYSLGLALLVESGRASELGFARSMRLLAGFGLLHGVHEWIDMFERGVELYYQSAFPSWLLWLRLSILVTSFLALLAFGENLLLRERQGNTFSWRITLGVIVWYVISNVIAWRVYNLDDAAWVGVADVLSRYVIGVPGALLACLALWRQRVIFRERGMGRFVRDLTIAAVALALYGVVGQVFTRQSEIFPSTVINSALFLHVTGFPVQLLRAAMAAVVAVSMIRVLRALEVENQQRLDTIKQAKLDVEQRSREELTQLNTELKHASEETARLLREVQRRDALRGGLLQRITAAQEAERQRIARELHDGTGQALTGLAMGLRGMSTLVSQQNPETTKNHLSDLEITATTALSELRHLINDLRPPQLDDMGLVAALRWLVERFNERSALQAEWDVQGTPHSLPFEVETTLFRIAQEGLNNIAKHARANHVWVKLNFDGEISLVVRDDGIGFDPVITSGSDSLSATWGLAGMKERANLINATLTLESASGQGTTLTIRLSDLQREEITHAN